MARAALRKRCSLLIWLDKDMARRLAGEEAIFAGTSTGANIVAALRIAARLGKGKTVATLIADSGLRYLSTDVFRSPG